MRADQALLQLYREWVLGRVFEQRLEQEHTAGRVPGLLHTGVGQAAAQAALADGLRPTDCFFPDDRCHGLCLRAGTAGEKLMADIFVGPRR